MTLTEIFHFLTFRRAIKLHFILSFFTTMTFKEIEATPREKITRIYEKKNTFKEQ